MQISPSKYGLKSLALGVSFLVSSRLPPTFKETMVAARLTGGGAPSAALVAKGICLHQARGRQYNILHVAPESALARACAYNSITIFSTREEKLERALLYFADPTSP